MAPKAERLHWAYFIKPSKRILPKKSKFLRKRFLFLPYTQTLPLFAMVFYTIFTFVVFLSHVTPTGAVKGANLE